MKNQAVVFTVFFSGRRRHTRSKRDWSSDVCSSDLVQGGVAGLARREPARGTAGLARRGAAVRRLLRPRVEREALQIGRAAWRGRGADGVGDGVLCKESTESLSLN